MHLHKHLLNRSGLIKNTEISNKLKLSLKHGKVYVTQEDSKCVLRISINAEPETQ